MRQDDRALQQRRVQALERIADALEMNAVFPTLANRPIRAVLGPGGTPAKAMIQTPAVDVRSQNVPDVTDRVDKPEPMTEDDV